MAQNAKSKVFLAFVVSILGLMVFVSSYCLALKRDALQFHTRDYNYFIEQAARLTDPQMSKRFTLNIEGYNFLGLQGIEGVKSLYHAIHAEYFRYTYVALYGIFQHTLPIYIFYSVMFFLPILYFALIALREGRDVWKPALFFTLLYVLFPATLNAVTADLRPRLLFIPAWSMVALAIYYNRPFIEKLVCFLLLLSIREEAILLGAFLIALNFLYLRGAKDRWKQTLVWLALDIAALAIFLAFMAWGGYNQVDRLVDPRNVLNNLRSFYLPLALVGLALMLVFVWVYLNRRVQLNNMMILVVYLAAIFSIGIPLVTWLSYWYGQQSLLAGVGPVQAYLEAVTNPLTALSLYMGLLLLVFLLDFFRGLGRRILVIILSTLCVVFAVTTLMTFPRQLAAWKQNILSARLVWDFVHNHDRLQTDVLLDYETYQAFYNFENILVYNRLPLWLALPQNRFYPENQAAVVRHIRRRMEYAVVSLGSVENILELAKMAGVPVTEVASNERYVVLKFGN